MERKDGPPAIPSLKGATLANLKQALVSLARFVSVAMQPVYDEETVVALDFYIKGFLTHFEKLDRGMRDEDKLPTWVTCYNFLSLLNMPVAACYYGPPRNLWEGGLNGEGIIRFAKKEHDGGTREGWQLATMNKIYFVRKMGCVNEDIQGPAKPQREKEWDRYKDLGMVEWKLSG